MAEKRYNVTAVDLMPTLLREKKTDRDEGLYEFAQRFEDQLNTIKESGWVLLHMHWVENRGVVLVCDTNLEERSSSVGAAVQRVSERDLPPMLEAVQTILNNFARYALERDIKTGTNREERELEQFLARCTKSVPVDSIQQYVQNLQQICLAHQDKCTACDERGCGVLHLLQLTKKKLEGLLRERIQ